MKGAFCQPPDGIINSGRLLDLWNKKEGKEKGARQIMLDKQYVILVPIYKIDLFWTVVNKNLSKKFQNIEIIFIFVIAYNI